jgi:hypothetical protein
MVIYSLLLIVLMITRPQGLLGQTAAFKARRTLKAGKSRKAVEKITGAALAANSITGNSPASDPSIGKEKSQ